MCTLKPVTQAQQRGFSIVEAIVFIVIVSVALTGILSLMNFTTQHSADPMIRKQAIVVAESLLAEITQQNFSNPADGFSGSSIQSNRHLFDDIGDYNSFTTTGIFPIDDPSTPIPALIAYNASVRVVDTTLGPVSAPIPNGSVKLIIVTITGPGAIPVVLSGYRSAYGS